MRASRWATIAACVSLAACGGAIAPTGGEGDGGGGGASSSSSSGGGNGSGVIGGSSSGSGGVGSSTSGSSGGSSTSSGSGSGAASSSGTGSSGGATVDAAFGCSNGVPPPMTGSAACDACIEASCGDSWCACAGDSSLDDGGGFQGCLGYVNCVSACLFPPPNAGVDAGTIQQCAQLCAPAYGQQQVQEGNALLGCIAGNCSTVATCGQ